MSRLVEKMSLTPAGILGIAGGSLKTGRPADIVILDTKKEYMVDPEKFISMGKNTPFGGYVLSGMPVITIAQGRLYEWQ
jgi:dihydroorotase